MEKKQPKRDKKGRFIKQEKSSVAWEDEVMSRLIQLENENAGFKFMDKHQRKIIHNLVDQNNELAKRLHEQDEKIARINNYKASCKYFEEQNKELKELLMFAVSHINHTAKIFHGKKIQRITEILGL